jgi:G3E family GTPase
VSASAPLAAVDGSIPLTVIGGFLGTGKTTLVNHLLATAERRWGVLVNDFGAVNVDAALIAESGSDSVSLANGCVCCAMGDDLGDALARLVARTPAPEHIIIEASGVGDPWRIAQLALIEPGFSLEPLVVLADATALPAQLADRWIADTVRTQLDHAELFLLTKSDLAAPAPTEAILATARPAAPIRRITAGRIAAADLTFPIDPLTRPRPSRFAADAAPHPFRTWHWRPSRPIDRDRLRPVLETLPPSVLRLKGIAPFAPGTRLVLQYAARRWSFTPAETRPDTGLVLIGTPDLPDAATLQALFDATLAC